MRGLAARNGGRLGMAAVAAILLLALALRLDYAWEGREPVFDAVAYGKIAANLTAGDGFTVGEGATQPPSNYSPGLPLLVAGLYELSGGDHERFVRLVLAFIGTLAVLLTYLIGRRLAGPFAGLVAALAVTVYPALLEYQGMLMGEPLAATLLSGAVLGVLWASDSGPATSRAGPVAGHGSSSSQAAGEDPRPRTTRAKRWLLPGLLLGALTLTRPEYLAVAVVLALVVLVSGVRADRRGSATHAALVLLGVVLVVAPWTVRNAIVLDRFTPVSTGGGQVLFAGQYMPSGGDPEGVGREVLERHPGLTRKLSASLPGRPGANSEPAEAVLQQLRLEQILAALAEQRHPGMETDRALARMGRERLWDNVSERPLEYAGFVTAKLWNLWGHGPRDVMERPGWELFHWALLAFGLIGLVVLLRGRRWEALILLAVLLTVTAVSAALVASPRRTLVMLPLVAALAGVGATACRDSLARRWSR